MKVLREKDSNKIFAITLDDDSIIIIPPGQDPEEESIEITLDRTETGVRISGFRISLIKWLELTEQVRQELIKAGWKSITISQVLPRGV